jgi:phosphoribosylformylglycinamidine synthase
MSISSSYGAIIKKPQKLTNLFQYFFGEDQGRYLLEVEPSNLKKVEKSLKDSNIYFENIGLTQKDYFEIEGELKINIKDLFKINNEWYNNY